LNYPIGTLEVALVADGVAQEELYPLDVERGLAKLAELNAAQPIIWYDSGAQQVELLTNELAHMAIAWNGRMLNAAREGIPLDYIVEGAVNQSTSWVVLSTAPHPKAAMEFINFATTPEINAADSLAFLGNTPANADAFALIPDELAARLPTNPELADRIGGYVDDAWWADNFDEVYARWQDWYSGL
jgi:putative spermidine/putrescine transport system substrate-binding protein